MTEMAMIIRDVKDIAVTTPPTAPGIFTKVLADESNSRSMRVGLMSWAPGTRSQTQPHYHSVEELQLVLHGHATLEDSNGDKYALRPGTMFLCPPGIEGTHGIENTSDFPMTLLFIYPRQVYETVKCQAPVSGRRLQNKIALRHIEDVTLQPQTQRFPNASFKMICGKGDAANLSAGIMWLEPGGKVPGVYHSVEEFQLVLYGNAALSDCNGQGHRLREGVMLLCPPGAGGAHGVENTGDSPTCILFAYPSQEFETTPYVAP
jgi:quercetin dioxygenase-like cupin family protein